jgi:hypothetical protein
MGMILAACTSKCIKELDGIKRIELQERFEKTGGRGGGGGGGSSGGRVVALLEKRQYCYCDECKLYFENDKQRRPKSGAIKNCLCCRAPLRFTPNIGSTHDSKAYQAYKAAKHRY